MEMIPVEQITAFPLLLILELITAAIFLTAGLVIVNKKMKQNNRKKLIAGGAVGVLTGIAMIGVLLGVNAHVSNTNDAHLRAAVTEIGQNLNEEQLNELATLGTITVADDKTLLFQDEGMGYSLTMIDSSENAETQSKEEKEWEKRIKENDF